MLPGAVLGVVLCVGCVGYVHATGGVASNLGPKAPAALGAVLDGAYGGAIGSPSSIWPSLDLRVRAGEGLVQVAPGLSLRAGLPSLVTPIAGLGVRLLSFEVNDSDLGFGMFSPYLQLGLFVGLHDRGIALRSTRHAVGAAAGFVVHADAGYDVRFTHQPSSLWASASIGYAAYFFGY